jgi:hypothetical protein
MMQWVDVGEAMANGPGQRRIISQTVFFACEECHGIGSPVPFGFDGRKNLFSQFGVGYQFAVTRSQSQVAFSQGHVHVGEQGLEEGPLLDHFLQQSQCCFALFVSGAV